LNRYICLHLKRFRPLRGADGQVTFGHTHHNQGHNVDHTFFSRARNGLVAGALGVVFLSSPLAAQASPHHGPRCESCGTVMSVHTYERAAEHGSGVGIASGALIGGFLGNRVGSGNGRKLATVAGAVGGGYAGNEIERNARSRTMTDVKVRMETGAVRHFTEEGARHYYSGQHVRVDHGALVTVR
jgi:outer membrane lipoprotein SlyB